LPYTLLIALAKPIKEILGRPVCCTLQGEDLFLEGLLEPYRSEALDLIRANINMSMLSFPVSDYYAEFMPGYLGYLAKRFKSCRMGINLEGIIPLSRKRGKALSRLSQLDFSRVLPRERAARTG